MLSCEEYIVNEIIYFAYYKMGDEVGDNIKCDAETPALSVFLNLLLSPMR